MSSLQFVAYLYNILQRTNSDDFCTLVILSDDLLKRNSKYYFNKHSKMSVTYKYMTVDSTYRCSYTKTFQLIC